jgi:hypothetical protein
MIFSVWPLQAVNQFNRPHQDFKDLILVQVSQHLVNLIMILDSIINRKKLLGEIGLTLIYLNKQVITNIYLLITQSQN